MISSLSDLKPTTAHLIIRFPFISQEKRSGPTVMNFQSKRDQVCQSPNCTEGRRELRGAFQLSFSLVISHLISIIEQRYFAYLKNSYWASWALLFFVELVKKIHFLFSFHILSFMKEPLKFTEHISI